MDKLPPDVSIHRPYAARRHGAGHDLSLVAATRQTNFTPLAEQALDTHK